jgi:glycine/D-amino acid oxidase-like deaminating enzyme
LFNLRNGHLHPLNLCLGEARAAVDLGVEVYEDSGVVDIVHGAKPVVKTAGGSVKASFVVLAGNAYHNLERKNLRNRLFPAGSFILATEPLDEDEAKALNPQDVAVCDQNEVIDYFRMSADHRLIFGGRRNYSGREPRSIEGAMRPRMEKVFPQLAGRRVDNSWGGKIGVVPNRIPMLGRINGNVLYARGYCGHGVNMTHAFSEILADAIGGVFEKIDLFEKVPHRRIPFGRKLSAELMAMAVFYYRLRDNL